MSGILNEKIVSDLEELKNIARKKEEIEKSQLWMDFQNLKKLYKDAKNTLEENDKSNTKMDDLTRNLIEEKQNEYKTEALSKQNEIKEIRDPLKTKFDSKKEEIKEKIKTEVNRYVTIGTELNDEKAKISDAINNKKEKMESNYKRKYKEIEKKYKDELRQTYDNSQKSKDKDTLMREYRNKINAMEQDLSRNKQRLENYEQLKYKHAEEEINLKYEDNIIVEIGSEKHINYLGLLRLNEDINNLEFENLTVKKIEGLMNSEKENQNFKEANDEKANFEKIDEILGHKISQEKETQQGSQQIQSGQSEPEQSKQQESQQIQPGQSEPKQSKQQEPQQMQPEQSEPGQEPQQIQPGQSKPEQSKQQEPESKTEKTNQLKTINIQGKPEIIFDMRTGKYTMSIKDKNGQKNEIKVVKLDKNYLTKEGKKDYIDKIIKNEKLNVKNIKNIDPCLYELYKEFDKNNGTVYAEQYLNNLDGNKTKIGENYKNMSVDKLMTKYNNATQLATNEEAIKNFATNKGMDEDKVKNELTNKLKEMQRTICDMNKPEVEYDLRKRDDNNEKGNFKLKRKLRKELRQIAKDHEKMGIATSVKEDRSLVKRIFDKISNLRQKLLPSGNEKNEKETETLEISEGSEEKGINKGKKFREGLDARKFVKNKSHENKAKIGAEDKDKDGSDYWNNITDIGEQETKGDNGAQKTKPDKEGR